ncbi:MAG: hypothetical protein IJD25_01990 [Alphaproteobacteria bacterium]|nr:hypothetical protein [Alphaproteobacteria bacterium]
MKKGFVLGLMLASLVGGSYPVFADGMDPELEIFEDPAYVKKYYDTLVKVNNIDTSFKFKQPALNGVLLGLYGNVYKTYMVVTKDKIFISGVENTSNYIGLNPAEKNCEILKDEIDYTLIRCPSYNDFEFLEFKNRKKDGSGPVCRKKYSSTSKIFDETKFGSSCDVFF